MHCTDNMVSSRLGLKNFDTAGIGPFGPWLGFLIKFEIDQHLSTALLVFGHKMWPKLGLWEKTDYSKNKGMPSENKVGKCSENSCFSLLALLQPVNTYGHFISTAVTSIWCKKNRISTRDRLRLYFSLKHSKNSWAMTTWIRALKNVCYMLQNRLNLYFGPYLIG